MSALQPIEDVRIYCFDCPGITLIAYCREVWSERPPFDPLPLFSRLRLPLRTGVIPAITFDRSLVSQRIDGVRAGNLHRVASNRCNRDREGNGRGD